MRSLSVRLLLSLFTLVLAAPVVFAHDITVSGTTTFAALDGSSSDHDGSANGVFTVSDGNLVINGTVNCNDDGGGDNACSMAFVASGNLTINSGAAFYAENRSGAGVGGAISMTAGGNIAVNGTAIVSTSSRSSSGSNGGNITATAGGSITLASGTTIDAGSSNAKGGNVTVTAGNIVTVNGAVLSGPSRTILSTRWTGAALDGGTANQQGGAITIGSSTFVEPAVLIGPTANIIAQGETTGAGPITINGCGIQIYGLVAALSRKDAPAKVVIRSGKDVLVDGRDLGTAATARLGRVRADAPSGTAINKGVDIFAAETIDLLGASPAASTQYSISSIPGQHDSKSYGGLIRVISLGDVINASGLVIDDGHTASGDTGGTVQLSSKGNANLAGAYIRAIGDFNTGNNNRGGGSIAVRSYSGDVIWTNGLGEVRPVGSTSGLATADQGKIVINACGSITTTGTSFPVMGTATSVFPETHTGVCSPAAPSLPAGTLPLVTCNTPPVANDTTASTLEDQSVTVTLTGTDADGDSLTFSIVSGPAHGSLSSLMSTGPTSATVVYTPNLNYNGTDSFTFRADDGNGGTDDAVATVTITAVNDAPSFQIGPTATALEDSGAQTYANWVTSISAGPSDEAGQTVTFTVTNDNPSLFSVQPAVAPDGTLTYTPAANAYGSANVTVVAHDNGGTANGGADTSASQTSSISITAVNDAPSFTAGGNVNVLEDSGAYSAAWASAISAGPNESSQNVSFVATNDNNALFTSQPAISSTGVLTFTVAANANGTAVVSVYAQDDGGTANGGVNTSAVQTFTITVDAVNDAPSFTSGGDVTVLEDSGAYSAAWATAISAGPSDESAQTVSFSTSNNNNAMFATQPAISSTGVLSFTLAANAFGSATVTVTLSDNGGTANGGADTSAAQTFTINVTGVNDEPSFTPGADVTINEDSGAYSAAWASAISAGPNESGQTVSFNVSNSNNGLFASQPSISPSGVLSFTLAADASGSATVTVSLSDDGGTANGGDDTSASVTFTITVNPVNDAPSFTAGGNVTVNEDSGAYSAAWATAISAGPANEASQTVSFNVSNNNNGLFSAQPTISATGVLSFTLAADATGSATVTVSLSDNGGTANGGVDTSASVTFTINVDPVNDAPSFVAGGDVTVNEDSGAYSAAWASAISAGPNESGQTVSFNVSNSNNALFSSQPVISPAGVLMFTAAPNAFGSATVTVSLSDNGGTANGGVNTSAAVTFTINITAVNDGPTAGNDSFETFGNTEVRVDLASASTPNVLRTTSSGTGVLDNDSDLGEGDPISVTGIVGCADTTSPYDCTLGGGAKVSMNANGTFSYTPAPGATTGSFQYVVTDNPAAGSPASATGTVNFTITGMIWYVNGSYVLPANGTSNAPFANFGSLNGGPDVDNPGDTIFVHDSVVNGSITMEANQKLLGEGVGLTATDSAAVSHVLVAAGNKPRVLGGAADTVTVTGVTGVEIAGLELNSTGSNGIEVRSNSLGSATAANIHDNFVNGAAAQGIFVNANAAAGTTATVSNTNISSTGAGFEATSTAGTVNVSLSNGTITSSAGHGVHITGAGGGTMIINGLSNLTVSATAANDGVNVTSASFNNVNTGTLSIGSAGARVKNGVVLGSVSGSLTFGTLNAYTAAGTGLGATASGSFTISGNSGTINSVNGSAISLTNATIGASDLTLTTVSSTNATNGIVLNNTGALGGLHVTGTGSASSGGTLSGHSGDAVLLTSTEDLSLAYMAITGNQGSGIKGTTVNGFVVANATISGNGNDVTTDESGINLTDLSGSASRPTSISNSTISNNYEFEVQITNSTGTLTNMQLTNDTISSDGASGVHGNLVNFLGLGNAVMTLNVSGGTYTGAAPATATAIHADHSGSSGSLVANVSGATITNNNTGVNVSAAGGANLTFDVDGNTVNGSRSHALNLFLSAGHTGTTAGKFRNNFIGTTGTAGSGSQFGFGVRVQNEALSPASVLVDNNTITEMAGFAAVNVNAGISSSPLTGTTAMTITNNTISNVAARAIIVQQNVGKGTVCADISNNSMSGIAGAGGDGTKIRIRQLTGGTFNVRQKQATAAVDPAELDDANSVGANTTTAAQISASGTFNYNAGACAQP